MHCSLKKAWFLHEKERHTVQCLLVEATRTKSYVRVLALEVLFSQEVSSCFHSKVHVGWGVIPVVVLEGFRS